MNDIKLKITIDGKEATTTLQLLDSELNELNNVVRKFSTDSNVAVKNLTNEVFKFSAVNDNSINSLYNFITTQDLSQQQIESVITSLQAQSRTLNINSQEWKNNQIALQNLTIANQKLISNSLPLQQANQKTNQGVQSLNMAMGQMGYAISDASVFLVNFRMGMMAISNNIPMVIQLFQQANAQIKATGGSLAKSLIPALVGQGGLMLAINGVMLLLNILPSLFNKSTKKIEEQKTAVDKLRESYSKLTKEEIQNQLIGYEKQLAELELKYPTRTRSVVGGVGATQIEIPLTEEERFKNDYEQLKILRERIDALKEINKDLGINENIENRIRLNREKLEKLNENEQSKNYWKNLVPQAKNIDEARTLLDKWVKADQNLINSKEKTSSSIDKEDSKINKLITDYNNLTELNELLKKSNLENESTTLRKINNYLKENLSIENQIKLLKLRKEIEDKRNIDIKTYEEMSSKSMKDIIKQPLPEVANYEKPKMETDVEKIRAANFELATMDILSNSVSEGFNNAGSALSSAMGQSIRVFQNANSLLQIFINSLIQATVQAIVMKTVMAGLDLATGGTASLFSSIFGGASGAVVTKPTLMVVGEGKEPEGVFPLSYLNNFPIKTGEQTIKIKLEPVELKQKGMDLRGVLKKVEKVLQTR